MSGKEYWRRVRQVESGLPEELFIVIDDSPIEANRLTAAKCIVEHGARVATAAEVEGYRERERDRLAQLRTDDLRREGISVVTVSATTGRKRR
jgi:hypothetical protein